MNETVVKLLWIMYFSTGSLPV